MTKATQQTGQELTLVAQAADGNVPATLDDCARLLHAATEADALVGNVRAIAVARSRNLMVDEQGAGPGEWLRWIAENWPTFGTNSHVHHLRKIGEMLLQWRSNSVARNTLLCLSFNKNVAIARLRPEWLRLFLDRHDVAPMTREEVRAAVNRWLKNGGEPPLELDEGGGDEPPRNLPAKPTQPDFLDVLFKFDDKEDPHAFATKLAGRSLDVDADSAMAVAGRSLQVVDALLPKVGNPARLAGLARGLRLEADRAEKLARGESIDG